MQDQEEEPTTDDDARAKRQRDPHAVLTEAGLSRASETSTFPSTLNMNNKT